MLDDDLREALSAAVESAELARRAGQRQLEIMNLLNAAEISIFVGEWNDTRAALVELAQRELNPATAVLLRLCRGDAGGTHRRPCWVPRPASNSMPSP